MKIITGILIFVMMFGISFVDTQAVTQYNGGTQGVELVYSGSGSSDWLDTISNLGYDNGWIVYGYPQHQNLSEQGYMPDGDYDFSSVNEDYKYLMLANVVMNIYEYDYVFELAKGTTSWTIYVDSLTTDPAWSSDFNIPISHISNNDLRLLDGSQDVSGAYTSGYLQGRDDYAYDDNGTFYDAATWGQQQYQNGLSQGESNSLAIQNMIPGILGVMIAFFLQLASISVLGVTILDLIVLMFGLSIVLLLFRTLVK